ncbi:hypothetical protein PPL_01222 [Heterostelium album PN500]|uniref:Alpha-ketoglutarate-dependent dioxygenase AlkB-like domain-containing protein n=1 Tax=Heterostelium pallidum (strain ATCC 26659 / Pp 5 / PN500) TaxID=670386 RepID=D3AYG2_HETP5|nr:hypothetical protein PPL_01222 [Heterostelium album PN500]EFA85989.1 hypothetical protein PPL_01222 [Heterostelium album PN500]|eukprot:XP_020438095.1 hypothetical protein PPL_01222 [Heterostelium album PN500]
MYKTEDDNSSNSSNKGDGASSSKQQKAPSEYMKVQRMFRQQTKNEYGRSIPKHKRAPIDYSSVLDYRNIDSNTEVNKERIIDCTQSLFDYSSVSSDTSYYSHPSTWRVYGLKDYPGFYFIPSVFNVKQQRKWIKDALEHYAEPPNNTNLNIFYGEVKDLWSNAQSEYIELHDQLAKQLSLNDNDENVNEQQGEEVDKKKRPLDKNGEELPTYRTLLDKLAWATLGYQFQWTPRIYSEEFHEAFPQDLQDLVTHIAKATKYDPYVPEAATINFYSEGCYVY